MPNAVVLATASAGIKKRGGNMRTITIIAAGLALSACATGPYEWKYG
jgi:hypothetical protein